VLIHQSGLTSIVNAYIFCSGTALFSQKVVQDSEYAPTAEDIKSQKRPDVEDITQHKFSVAPMMEYTGEQSGEPENYYKSV
jgi:hypothetical protein